MEKKTIWLVEDGIATMPCATKSGATDYFIWRMKDYEECGASVNDMETLADGGISALVVPKVGKAFVASCYPATLHE